MKITASRRLRRECKGKGISSFEQLVYAIHFVSHVKNCLGWNHTEENIDIGLKSWDFKSDLLDSITNAS